MIEKAKYISQKEKTLYNDLDKAHKKLKEIANWYHLSDYKCNGADEKNQMIYVQLVNNIYKELSNLLFNTKNWRLYENLKEIIASDKMKSKLKDLSELEKLLQELKSEKINQISKEEYSLSFYEAIELCLNDNYFIVGEDFRKGYYAKNINGAIVLMTINNGFSHEVVDNIMITDGILKQKFKTMTVVNKNTLGIDK